MSRSFAPLIRAVDILVAASTVVGAASLIFMMLLIVVDVILTNAFHSPIPAGSAIVTHYAMVLVTFLPLALAEKTGGHVSVDVVYDLLPDPVRRVLATAVRLFTALVCMGMVYGLWGAALKKLRIGSYIFEQGVTVTTWPGHFVLPFGFGLMALVLLARAFLFRDGDPADASAPQVSS